MGHKKQKTKKKNDDFESQMEGAMADITQQQWSPMQLDFLGFLEGKSHAILVAGDDDGYGIVAHGAAEPLVKTLVSALNSDGEKGHLLRTAYLVYISLLFDSSYDGRKE